METKAKDNVASIRRTLPGRMGQNDFYKLCRALEQLPDPWPTTYTEMARIMTEKLGRPVTASTTQNALETIGRKLPAPERADANRRDARILAKAIVLLYGKLGELAPIDVREMAEG